MGYPCYMSRLGLYTTLVHRAVNDQDLCGLMALQLDGLRSSALLGAMHLITIFRSASMLLRRCLLNLGFQAYSCFIILEQAPVQHRVVGIVTNLLRRGTRRRNPAMCNFVANAYQSTRSD